MDCGLAQFWRCSGHGGDVLLFRWEQWYFGVFGVGLRKCIEL
jgi:hypothetical protein